MKFIFVLLFLGLCNFTFSQKITIQKTIIDGDQLIITYSLKGPEGQKFRVTVMASTDGGQTFEKEAITPTGDVGTDLESGKKKKIKWEAAKEMSMKLEDVKFTLKAEAVGMPPKRKKKK